MPITNDSLNKDLYRLLKVRGFDPVPKDSEGETTPVPDEADVFKFTFKRHDKPYGTAWVTVDSNQQLVVYFKDEINNVDGLDEGEDPAEYDDSWTGFLKNLKMWAQRRQLGFDIENQDHLASDMAQRTHMKKKEQISEGYYPMGKQASYSDAVPTVKIVLQHTRQIQEGEQRFRNIARIFLENTQGERILCPFNRPGMAQIYARHLAEGGKPNDERWNHIGSLCEEYTKMAGFARAVKNGQFNESAQKLVEAGMNHFTNLRESLGKMRGHRGYNAYFESWTPTLMETEGDEPVNINELFVQETLDPRIESVMPILSKLSKNLGEMKEVDELAEWADKLVEAPGDETLAHNQSTEEKRLKALDLDEDGPSDAEAAHQKIKTPAFMRQQQAKEKGGDWKVTGQDLEKAKERNISGPEGLAALKQLAGLGEDKGKIVVVNPESQQEMLDWLESEGFDAPEPTTDENGNLVYDFKDMDHNAYVYASDYDIGSKEADDDIAEQDVEEATAYDKRGITVSPNRTEFGDTADWHSAPFTSRDSRLKSRTNKTGSPTKLPSFDTLAANRRGGRNVKDAIKLRTGQEYEGDPSEYSTKPHLPEQGVAEGGILKSIKRGMQGWDKNAVGPAGEKLGDPREIVKRNKAYDIGTAKNIRAGLDDAPDHGPAGLQKRVLDRKLKGVAEGGVAGPKNCWPGYRKVGTQPGTGKNAGKPVNDCKKIDEDEFAGNFATGEKAQWRNKGPKANEPAKVGDLVGANESIERDPLDDLKRLLGK